MIVGIGAANIVPVLFTAAGRVPGVPPGIGLATVTTIGYAGLLVGPALIGFVADATSLQVAFVLVAAMFAAIAASAGTSRVTRATCYGATVLRATRAWTCRAACRKAASRRRSAQRAARGTACTARRTSARCT